MVPWSLLTYQIPHTNFILIAHTYISYSLSFVGSSEKLHEMGYVKAIKYPFSKFQSRTLPKSWIMLKISFKVVAIGCLEANATQLTECRHISLEKL